MLQATGSSTTMGVVGKPLLLGIFWTRNGELICYAMFPQKGEWFELQVSSAFYNKFLNANNVDGDSVNNLDI
jgi:hypothetical protein